MINTFKSIAEKEDAIFSFDEEIITVGAGVRDSHLNYFIKKEYRDIAIYLKNTTGTTFVGHVTCLIPKRMDAIAFEMTTRSHFLSLFFKGNRFKFSKTSPEVTEFMKNSIGFSQLKAIANDTSFEPTILGESNRKGFKLTIKYHLQFENWTQVIGPFMLFYKEFIDRFN